jgi:hypothetical protein
MKFFQHAVLHTGSATLTRVLSSAHLYSLAILPLGFLRRLPGFVDLHDKDRVLNLFSRRERVLNFATWTATLGGVAMVFIDLGIRLYWQLLD